MRIRETESCLCGVSLSEVVHDADESTRAFHRRCVCLVGMLRLFPVQRVLRPLHASHAHRCRIRGVGGLAKLQTDLTSPAMVNALKNDPTTTAHIETYLSSPDPAECSTNDQKQAAILYGDVNLKTTEGRRSSTMSLPTLVNGISASTKIQDLLGAILPPAALADSDGVLRHDCCASQLLRTLPRSGREHHGPERERKDRPGRRGAAGNEHGRRCTEGCRGMDRAGHLQCHRFGPIPEGQAPQATVIGQMYLLSTAPSSADPSVQNLSPNPYSPVNPSLKNLFDCAGIPMPS